MGCLAAKMAQSMVFCPYLPKNPYFEPFLWLNHLFLGLATFTKVDSLIKMSNFSFIKFSQKLGVSDLRNLVEPLGEPMLLKKVLCKAVKKRHFHSCFKGMFVFFMTSITYMEQAGWWWSICCGGSLVSAAPLYTYQFSVSLPT